MEAILVSRIERKRMVVLEHVTKGYFAASRFSGNPGPARLKIDDLQQANSDRP